MASFLLGVNAVQLPKCTNTKYRNNKLKTMRKNYTLLMLLMAFALQLTTASAQAQKLSFKELLDQPYFANMKEAMQTPSQVRRLEVNMTGKTNIPAELQKLPNIQMLTFSGSTRKINWAVAVPELQKLKNLQYLYFQDSGLQTIPAQIFTLTQLKGLAIINSGVKVLPADIAKLANLEMLILINNRISVLPVQVSTLKNLKTLYLDGNSISVFPPQMANLKKIEEISIADNPMKDEEIKKVHKFYPKAKVIEAYDMPVIDSPAE
jgi:Leucine-rich repeat (LRR) protein